MGKKGKSKQGKAKQSNAKESNEKQSNAKHTNTKQSKPIKHTGLPFVSVCTPTFNRRPFINQMITNFLRQDYPKERMEWIIIDDGTDKIGDLVKDVPCVKYFSYDEKMSLGKKRNLMHEKSSGTIIVYMDDDDYYPACRVSHAVKKLRSNPKALCAGSSEIYIWFNGLNKLYQFGPYGPNHSTAGTFAFWRRLLNDHKYEDEAALAEEKAFLKNYTVPFVQLDPMKTILVFSHEHNTFDKRKLLENPHPEFVKESNKKVEMFVPEEDTRNFYLNDIYDLLKDYAPGRPEMKPDVLEQTAKIENERRIRQEQQMAQQAPIVLTMNNGERKILSSQDAVQIIQQQQKQINILNEKVAELENNANKRDMENARLRMFNDKLLKKIRNDGNNGNDGNTDNSNNQNSVDDIEQPKISDIIINEIFD